MSRERYTTVLIVVAESVALIAPTAALAASLAFFANQPSDYDYGLMVAIPPAFGGAEFTFEIWVRLDNSYPVGSTADGEGQLLNWSDADNEPYSYRKWWYEGNFLLDGHNNAEFKDGTFSLQVYGSGRVRWLFGDGSSAGPGGHWSVGAYPAAGTPSLLDGAWHHLTLVRRFADGGGSDLELWVDGVHIATEWSPVRTDMRSFWDDWSGYPSGQGGWFFGTEKQAAIGVLDQYEDFKGLIGEIRFFDRAKSAQEIAGNWDAPVTAYSPGLVGLFRLYEGVGVVTCDELQEIRCMDLINMKPGYWSSESPPISETIFSDGFESGGTSAWSVVI